ncbi:caspase family protein [Actinoplanes sp. NEAU-A12]|uniref:Caspase family protein n=1 Tax=Actinoplanes sandaracinus TaxID=3045177 RepID=A0ABT6X0B6_9ACTN|nr:caspase family protein [Actinoplanes sandaracinus]MDI6105449.1 caspase family protein [Actinoplanes sandaracinus]
MKDAATTWALVVGIDEYDDPAVKRLTGAARDAAAAVRWLRALGVPDGQILLHAVPSAGAAAEVEALGLMVRGCTLTSIWKSVHLLAGKKGSRLFVFLCGHGLYEPGSKGLFLTQEAGDGAMTNLGIEKYSDHFLSMDFPLQVLVMDGCLNQPYPPAVRPTVEAAFYPGVAPRPTRPDTTLIRCMAVTRGQLALEDEGRGLFLRTFLKVLDPAEPHPDAVGLDHSTGAFRYDLRRAMLDVISPTVVETARQRYGRPQCPTMQVQGVGESWSTLPIVEIAPERTARIRVTVEPGPAVPAVRQIRIDADTGDWQRRVPAPPADTVEVPIDSVVPAGTRVAVRCLLRADALWRGPQFSAVSADEDVEVVIRLTRPMMGSGPGPEAGGTDLMVETVGPDGLPVLALGPEQYAAIERSLGELRERVTLVRHETGPILRAGPGDHDLLSVAAARAAQAITATTPSSVVAVVHSVTPLAPAGVRLVWPPGGPFALAGALLSHQDMPMVQVGEERLSVREVPGPDTFHVPPGPVPVRLTLPWGSWSRTVHAVAGETVEVPLPAEVGAPPLRVRFSAVHPLSRWGAIGGGTVVVLDAPAGLRAGDADRVLRADLPGLPVFRVPSLPWHGLIGLSDGEQRLVVPLHPLMPVLLAWGDQPRAEPLSEVPSPTWDLLVSAGRLDDLAEESMRELTFLKWEDPVLGLAGAYACFAQERHDHLAAVLANLTGIDPDVPDLTILRSASRKATGHAEDDLLPRLAGLAARGAVPVLRWGVPLAIEAANRHGLTDWAQGLSEVDRGLVSSSVWTVTRPPHRPGPDVPPG